MYTEESTSASEARSASDSSDISTSSRWFSAIHEGKLIPIESFLKENPEVMELRSISPTPFHHMIVRLASNTLGTDTTAMDGLQIAIMEYKNAYARWRLGTSETSGGNGNASHDKLRELINIREAILSEMLVAVTPKQLDNHRFGYFQNTTLHLAAFFNDTNLLERLLLQGANPNIANGMGYTPLETSSDESVRQILLLNYMQNYPQPSFIQSRSRTFRLLYTKTKRTENSTTKATIALRNPAISMERKCLKTTQMTNGIANTYIAIPAMFLTT